MDACRMGNLLERWDEFLASAEESNTDSSKRFVVVVNDPLRQSLAGALKFVTAGEDKVMD